MKKQKTMVKNYVAWQLVEYCQRYTENTHETVKNNFLEYGSCKVFNKYLPQNFLKLTLN